MKIRSAILATLSAVFLTAGTDFSNQNYTAHVGDWQLYRTPSQCWMMKQYPDGTQLKYNWSEIEQAAYFNLTNRDWSWIERGKDYDLTVEIDPKFKLDAVAVGNYRTDGAYSLGFFADDPLKFRQAIQEGKSIRIASRDQISVEYSLAGSQLAMDEHIKCASWLAHPESRK